MEGQYGMSIIESIVQTQMEGPLLRKINLIKSSKLKETKDIILVKLSKTLLQVRKI
jgi:hypothetical protein